MKMTLGQLMVTKPTAASQARHTAAAPAHLEPGFDIDFVRRHGAKDAEFVILLSMEELKSLQRGVVFILTAWSPPSLMLFRSRSIRLWEARPEAFPCYVVDSDSLNNGLHREFNFVSHGYCEMLWIRNGRPVRRLGERKEPVDDLILQYTEALMPLGGKPAIPP